MSDLYDAIVIGGGPAGLCAALYLARAKFSVLVIEKEKFGGQITITTNVVNYPGILQTTGKDLTNNIRKQAQNFGAKFIKETVTKVKLDETIKTITTNNNKYQSIGVVLATGSHPRKLGFPGEKEFQGHGVAYCATCDGEFFTGKQIFVIGGGFAAAQEAVFLTKYASKVSIIIREDDFTCAKQVSEQALNNPKIEVHYNTEIKEAKGTNQLEEATFINNKTNKTWSYNANNDSFGIFVFAGYQPETELFKNQIELSKSNNIIVDQNQKTNLEGVYGAGDVCLKELRQVVTAVSDGAIAATSLEKYIPNITKENNLTTIKINSTNQIETPNNVNDDSFISSDIKQQLQPILDKLERKIIIKINNNDSDFSKEMILFVEEFKQLSSLIETKVINSNEAGISLYDENDNYLNITYHAIPGGHEFNSFVLALYNAVGPKQPLENNIIQDIKNIDNNINIKVVVSLYCTMCPDVVMASQRIALENSNISVDIYDLAYYPDLKDKYNIMSVPCMIINDDQVSFGKKDIQHIIEIIK